MSSEHDPPAISDGLARRLRRAMTANQIYFGGPDRPPRLLRDLLFDYIEGTPSGGAIDWVTYYFRDRELARALLRARERGVRVELTLDGHPRTPIANRRVIELLSGQQGLGDGLRLVGSETKEGPRLRPRLHEKLYCFSAPVPVALVGSFNPSGNIDGDEASIVDAIRDQDRGHNLLVALDTSELVEALTRHARELHRAKHRFGDRFRPEANRRVSTEGFEIFFMPRARKNPLWRCLAACGRGDRVRVAASHLSGPTARRELVKLARRGVEVEVLAEMTSRRVPPRTERALHQAGIAIRRVPHREGLPMHAKFSLIEAGGDRCAVFGSFNWTERSLRLNREIGVITRDANLVQSLERRWETIAEQAEQGGGASAPAPGG